MTGTIQVKKGYLYAVINYKDEAGKTKYKWIATGLSTSHSAKISFLNGFCSNVFYRNGDILSIFD